MKQINNQIVIFAALLFCVICTNCAKNDSKGYEPQPQVLFAVKVEGLTSSNMKARITPKDADQVYFSSVINKAYFTDKWSGDVSKYLPYYIDSLSKKHACSTQEAMAMIKRSGESVLEYNYMSPSTTHLILVAGMDVDGKITTTPTMQEFKSLPESASDYNFKITMSEVSITRAIAHIVPSNPDAYYLHGIIQAEKYPSDPNKQKEFAQQHVNKLIEDAVVKYEIERPQALHCIRARGVEKVVFKKMDLSPNTQYLVFAICVDTQGDVQGDVATQAFATLSTNFSSNTFDVKVKNTTALGALIDVTPSNSDPYYLQVVKKSSLIGKTDQQIILEHVNDAITNASSGSKSFDKWKSLLLSDTEYSALIFGCDKEWASTAVKRIDFKTDPSGDPAICTFKFNCTFTDAFHLLLDVEPSDQTVFYHAWIVDPDDYNNSDQDVIDDFERDVKNYLKRHPLVTISDYLTTHCYRGTAQQQEFNYLQYAGDSLIAYAFAIDMSTAKVVSVVSKEAFEVPSFATSMTQRASVSLKIIANRKKNISNVKPTTLINETHE